MDELEHQRIMNGYFISKQIFENYVSDEVNNKNKNHKEKIKLLDELKQHTIQTNRFKSRNNLY